MKFYLSSYKLGNKKQKLKEIIQNKTLGIIPNAIDHIPEKNYKKYFYLLKNLDIKIELLNLKDYFKKEKELEKKLNTIGGVMVTGGNTFVLRQAMKLSGFDKIIKNMPDDFVYSGWSAGVCVLAPSLEGLQIVDDPTQNPYGIETIMEGLGILNYLILPHYKSNHPESADIDKEVEYCNKNNIKFKTLKDGEVIIIE